MKKYAIFLFVTAIAVAYTSTAQEPNPNAGYYRDIYPDTWVSSDALGRTMPGNDELGDPKGGQRRVVGMFYITWHTPENGRGDGTYMADVTRILEADPDARLETDNPLWYKKDYYHWGEPETGYFLSRDEWVIRKDMSMLSDAGVDVLVMDVTNAVRYWDEWDVLFTTMQRMKAEGNRVPQFCFWAFNGPVITVVQELYERIYAEEKYKDLWFYWDGKPLLLYNDRPAMDANTYKMKSPNPQYDPDAATDPNHPHYGDPRYTEEFFADYTGEVRDFFTLRTMWWGYYEWWGERFVGTEDNWAYGYNLDDPKVRNIPPGDLLSTHKGRREQAAVTAAGHALSLVAETPYDGVGKSWTRTGRQPKLNEYDMPVPTYVPRLGKTVDDPTAYGIYFQDRWDEAIEADPEFLYVNDWNEWTAVKLNAADFGFMKDGVAGFMGRKSQFFFVDQYNSEFNRTIQPMKGGYTDNYYMQMAQNIRRYKGARPIPELKGYNTIPVGNMRSWENIEVEYRDTKGDVTHRDALGYGGIHYVNNSGRNDIVTSKVAVDKKTVYFYCETAEALTSSAGNNWMLLFIDADNDPDTGWYGYDFAINKRVMNDRVTLLMKYTGGEWKEVAGLVYNVSGNKLEIAVPRKLLGLAGDSFTFDFKWSDNADGPDDPISFCLNGDTAPNRRFNYRCIWNK